MGHDHSHGDDHTHGTEPEAGGGLTGYALVKYGIILVIVLVILWFLVTYVFGGD
jgi:hypothetical protein